MPPPLYAACCGSACLMPAIWCRISQQAIHTRTVSGPRRVEAVVWQNDVVTERLKLCIIGLDAKDIERLKELVNTVLPAVARRRPTAQQCPVLDFHRHIHRIFWTSSNDLGEIIKGDKSKRCCHFGCCKHNKI